MRFSEKFKIIPLCEPKDYGSAGIDFDSVNMALVFSMEAVIEFGILTGNSILTVYSGATAGAKTTAVAFQYRFGSGDFKATDADGLGDLTSVASTGLTLTAASFDHRQLIIAIRPDQVSLGYVTISIDSTATAMNVASVGLGDPRYSIHGQVSVL